MNKALSKRSVRGVLATTKGVDTPERPEKSEIPSLRPAERSEKSESQLRNPQSTAEAKRFHLILLVKAFGDWHHPLTRLTDFETWTFSTSHELTHILKNSTSLAEDFLTIRTETGPLHGELRVANNNKSGYISLIANQPLFCCIRTFSGSSICFSAVIDERKQIKANHYHNYSNNLLRVLDTAPPSQDFRKSPTFVFFIYPGV